MHTVFKKAPHDVLAGRRIVKARRKFPRPSLLGSSLENANPKFSHQQGEISIDEDDPCHVKRCKGAEKECISDGQLGMSVAEEKIRHMQAVDLDGGSSGFSTNVKSYSRAIQASASCHYPGSGPFQLGNVSKILN